MKKYLHEEFHFINLKSDNKDLKYARQNFINKRMSIKRLFWIYGDEEIVGYTMNEKKTKIIRIFYNRHDLLKGDLRSESVRYPITSIGSLDDVVYPSNCLF
jgi:hypothetical protein